MDLGPGHGRVAGPRLTGLPLKPGARIQAPAGVEWSGVVVIENRKATTNIMSSSTVLRHGTANMLMRENAGRGNGEDSSACLHPLLCLFRRYI